MLPQILDFVRCLILLAVTGVSLGGCLPADDIATGEFSTAAFECNRQSKVVHCVFADVISEAVASDNGGFLDHGVEPMMILRSFSRITEQDFNGVAVAQGQYSYANGQLRFTQNLGPIDSAMNTMTSNGYATLLNNIKARISRAPETADQVRAFVKALG